MPPEGRLSFPFTVRDMLAFQHGAAFALKIVSQSISTSPLIIRGMTSEGLFAFVHTPTSDSVISTERFRIADIPIWVSITDKNGSLVQGDTYATLSIEINGDTLYDLASGLVYRQKSISWPSSSNFDIRPNGGRILKKVSAVPAAGANATLTVPAGQIWKILGATTNLTTGAAAANRRVRFDVNDTTHRLYFSFGPDNIAASDSQNINFVCIGSGVATLFGGDILIPIPENMWCMPGNTIQTNTANIQAADQFTALVVWVEQFFYPG